MRIRFHADGPPDCPLLVLTDLQPGDVARLLAAIDELVHGSRAAFWIHKVLDVVGDVRLQMALSDPDIGVVGGPLEFVCRLTSLSWYQVAGLLEPFESPAERVGHPWLDDSGEIQLLVSRSGGW